MKLTDKLEFAVQFAGFCARHALDPRKTAELITLAKRAKRAGEVHCNDGTYASHREELRAAARFEEAAGELGFETSWPGLWPVLEKDGFDVMLPSD